MSAITIIFSEETFQNLKSFNNVSELNEAVRKHIDHNRKSLNKNAVRILRYLKDYSKKYKGVSYKTKSNIAKDLGLSRRTVIRNCNLLEELEIIKQYEMKRNSDFMQTSNAIVIQPFVNEDSESVTPVSHQKEPLFKKQNNNNHLNTKRSPYIKFVPKCLQHFQAYFGERIKDIYSRIWLSAKKLKVSTDQETMQRIGFIAMEQLKQYIKDGKQFTEEQLCKIAYKIGLNQLEQHFNRQTAKQDIHTPQQPSGKKAIRTEVVPEWLKEDKQQQQEQKKPSVVSEERKRAIEENLKKMKTPPTAK